MHEHPEDHDKIEKLKDLIAWQVKNFKSGWSGPTAVQRQFSGTSEKIVHPLYASLPFKTALELELKFIFSDLTSFVI